MSDKVKQILLIAGFAISVIAIGAGLYFAFFRQVMAPTEPEPVPDEEVTEAPTGLPGADEGGPIVVAPEEEPEAPAITSLADAVAQGRETQVQLLTSSGISAPAATGNQLNYYDQNDGRFYQINQSGEVVSLSDQQFPQADSVVWNGEADKAIIEFPDGSNIVYDFTAQSQVTLPKHWEDFDFSDDSDQIVAKNMAVDPDNRWLVTSNADGSNVKAVQALGLNADKVQVSWSPSDTVIAFADTAEPLSGGLDRKMILPIGQNQENYQGIVVEGLGFMPNWSPNGRQLMYSAYGSYSSEKPLLWVVDATPASMGDNRRSLGLNTWADKCVFTGNTTAYCAVPQNLPANAGFQRSLYRNYPDSLYQVDLNTGRTSLVAIPEQDTAMENLTISDDGSLLYYTEADTGRLGTLRLK